MQYRKLRALLLFARKIRETFPHVQSAHVEFQDGSFPDEFVQMIEGKLEVPTVQQLQEMRPKPQGVFDSILLLAWCRNRLTEGLMEEGSEFCLVVDLVAEE
jgi:hypothetical protein